MEIKYNLGCGENKRRGFINVDRSSEVKPDIKADVTVIPWKWAKPADLIFASNLFEHIREEPLLKVMQECHRVLKPNGLLQIVVPIASPDNFMAMFSDSSHVNHNFTLETYDYFDHRHIRWKRYGKVYGNPKFERTRQERQGRFLMVELRAVKVRKKTLKVSAKTGGNKMKIGIVLPHLGICGGVRYFLEIGNIFVDRGIDYTIFSNQWQKCDWFDFKGKIKDWSNIEADYILMGDPPSFRILPKVKGKIFIYVMAGGHFLDGYRQVYGKYPFVLISEIFAKYFPDSRLVGQGVNTEWFKPKKRKVLFYDDPRPCKESAYIKKQLSGLENIELIGLKGLNNKEIAKAYRKGDYFVSWESREGWSSPSAEAIASGLTVVTNGVNCESFSNRVITVKNLREFFINPMKDLSWERVVDNLLEVFRDED